MLPPLNNRPKLASVLELLSGAVEDLLQGGLTTASESTKSTINLALQEASRFRWLRLGSSLRSTLEELARYQRQEPGFSKRRLAFFLSRSWLLSRGIAQALQSANEPEYDRLTWSPSGRSMPEVEVVCLGVVKKVAVGAFVAFDFRLRATLDLEGVEAGQRLSWSVVFPIKPGSDIPPEGYLHLPQKQKFKPILFLERKSILIHNALLSVDDSGGGRISLLEGSTVSVGKPFQGWSRFLDWSPKPAADRVARYQPGPLDLETELQEEIVVRDYQIARPTQGDEPGQSIYQVKASRLDLVASVGAGIEGNALTKSLDALRKPKATRSPMFGLMHYERCRLMFQPLSTFGPDGPEYLNISREIVNRADLLKAMSFT